MGCVTSKHLHQNIFNVVNVNDNRQMVSPGQLEVTDVELILHQKGKEPTRWPFNVLRKYGCDVELFTFECGRMCPTGEGIYAFRCRKAEQLFNLLQRNLTVYRNIPNFPPSSNGAVHNEPNSSTGPTVHRRVPSLPGVYLNPVSTTVVPRTYPTLSRPGSMNSSNGQVSPSAISPPPSATETFEHNNNKRGSLIPEPAYTNASVIAQIDNAASYINVNALPSPTLPTEDYVNVQENSHLYMNVPANEITQTCLTNELHLNNIEADVNELDAIPCYENIGLDAISVTNNGSVPQTPTANVNYAQLNLDSPSSVKVNSLVKPESPSTVKDSYATIDFIKSIALMQSINTRIELEDGSRKTRHNASISETSCSTNGKHRCSLSD